MQTPVDVPRPDFGYLTNLDVSNGTVTLTLVLGVIVTLTMYIYYSYYKYSARFMEMANKIPGPRCFPVIGSAYLFGTNSGDILQNVADCTVNYGVVSAYWIGPLLYVCLSKACDIEAVLGNNNLLKKTKANDLMKSGVGEGILTSSGHKWKKHRKLLQPSFHYHTLEEYIRVFVAKTEILNDILESKVDQPDFNICPYTSNLVFDILSETLMESKSNEQETRKQAQFVTSLTTCLNILICRFFKPWLYVDSLFYKTASGKTYRTNMDYVHRTIDEKLLRYKENMKREETLKHNASQVENGKKKKKSFVEHLLDVSQENGLTEKDTSDEAKTMVMAGFDTTAAALGFLCFVLSKRFDIQEKIVEEIKEVLGTDDRPIVYQDVQSFKYLERFVKETLRVLPTIPYVARQITEDVKLPSGYTLPSGCGVIIPFIRFQRDPEEYSEPHVFDPDNFLPEKVAERHPYAFCPFSAGPRNCIGQKYAMLQLKVFVVCLLRKYWLTPCDFKLDLSSKISMTSRNGVNIGVRRRTPERPVIPDYENLSKRIVTNVDLLNVEFKDKYV